jgi:hypothetical protein
MRIRDLVNLITNKGAIIIIAASYSRPDAKDVSTEDGSGLKRFLLVAIGLRIILQENLWI